MNKQKTRGAVKTVAIMMGATVLSKLLGMLRGILQANAYGTTETANAFTAASKLPLAFFDMFLAAAVLGCFIPAYNSFMEKGDLPENRKEADKFACIFLNFIIVICSLFAIIGILFAKPFICLIASGLSNEATALAVTLTRIMFPLIIFTGSAYTLVGVLQSKGSFIAPAIISAVSNLGVVIYLVFFNAPLGDMGIYGLAAAYLLSWVIQLITLILPLKKLGFSYKLLFNFKNPTLIKALKAAPPIMVGSWLTPAGILLGQYFASKISMAGQVPGAATIFDYSSNIYIIIVGTLTYSICNYTFPKIARLSGEDSSNEFFEIVRNGITSALLIIVPFMAAALVLSGEGTAIIYLRGEFTPNDAYYTARTLNCILPAMPFFAITELFSRVFYSKNQPYIVMLGALFGIAANLTAGFILTRSNLFDVGAVGISNAAGQIICSIVLLFVAMKKLPGIFSKELFINLIKIIIGGVIVYIICTAISKLLNSNPYEQGFIINVIYGLITFIPSTALYLVYSKLTGLLKKK